MADDHKKEIDQLSGTETTGHEWDGIQELNNPMPRWWLWTFFVCILVAICYWILFPAWPIPGGNTKGMLGWTKYNRLAEQLADAQGKQEVFFKQIAEWPIEKIPGDPKLYAFAVAAGQAAFKSNCVMCHGLDASGQGRYPNLNDDDWLWGEGTLADIQQTITHGIRTDDPKTRFSEMPAFGKQGVLKPEQISKTADFVISLAKKPDWNSEAGKIFKDQCVSCHGMEGKGDRKVGVPNLADAIWLYGGDKESIVYTITNARNNVMPNWNARLDPNTIKALAVYVHSLGGGK